MDSLANYGSDDECEESNSEKMGTSGPTGSRTQRLEADANYEEVQMDLSEESNNNTNEEEQKLEKRKSRSPDPRSSRDSRDSRKRRDRSEEKRRDRERDDDRRRDRDDRHDRRRDDRKRDEKRRRRSSSKERRRSNSRERKRSNSRGPRRSRSPRREDRSPRRDERSPRRDDRRRRSSSKERRHGKRFDRTSTKIAQLEKLGIELPGEVTPQLLLQRSMDEQVQKVKHSTGIELPKYYNPAAMNPARYADQIQKRRLLWQKKDEPAQTATNKPKTQVWESTTFAQDSDGKVASKFKRLMGIKDAPGGSKDGAKDILKKQEEMFSSMEQQYEVARTATHTMRGVGLGFGSFNYSR